MRKVSVGMPVRNGQAFISEAIESILGQTYGDLELVISDNASTDATAEICNDYAKLDHRIQYIGQGRNIGAHPNHIEVFRRSSGPYFKWAAHDDRLAPECVAKCVHILETNEDVVLCAPATVLINEDGSLLQPSSSNKGLVDSSGMVWRVDLETNQALTSRDPAERFAAAVWHTHLAFQIYGLIRRSALERTRIMPSYYGADKAVLVELALIGRYFLLGEPLFYRRCHGGQGGNVKLFLNRGRFVSGAGPQWISPQLRKMLAYTRAAAFARLTPTQRLRCFCTIGKRFFMRGLQGLGVQISEYQAAAG
jgi:glycosyltransferase involved in cell wall biosynthesis